MGELGQTISFVNGRRGLHPDRVSRSGPAEHRPPRPQLRLQFCRSVNPFYLLPRASEAQVETRPRSVVTCSPQPPYCFEILMDARRTISDLPLSGVQPRLRLTRTQLPAAGSGLVDHSKWIRRPTGVRPTEKGPNSPEYELRPLLLHIVRARLARVPAISSPQTCRFVKTVVLRRSREVTQ